MHYRKLMLMIALGFSCVSWHSAGAADLCIQIAGGGSYAVLKSPRFQLNCCPPTDPSEANTCAPLNGFEAGAVIPGEVPPPPGGGGAITGTGCVDPQFNQFMYHYVYHNALTLRPDIKGYFETGVCVFKLDEFSNKGERLNGLGDKPPIHVRASSLLMGRKLRSVIVQI